MRRNLFSEIPKYTYTILSNCNGGQVLVNGNPEGYIQNGEFVYQSTKPTLNSVEITGFKLPDDKDVFVKTEYHTRFILTDKSALSIYNSFASTYDGSEFTCYVRNADLEYMRQDYETDQYKKTTYKQPAIKKNVYPGNISMKYTKTDSTYTKNETVTFEALGNTDCWGNNDCTLIGSLCGGSIDSYKKRYAVRRFVRTCIQM